MNINDKNSNTDQRTYALIMIICMGLMLPMIINWNIYVWNAPPSAASWLGSGIVLLATIICYYLNKRKNWLHLPSFKVLLSIVILSLILTVISMPYSLAEPEMITHGTIMFIVITGVGWLIMRRYSAILLLPIILLGMVETGAYLQYKTMLNSMIVIEALECSKEEFMTYVTTWNLVLMIGGVCISALGLFTLFHLYQKTGFKSVFCCVLSLFCCLYILYPFVPNENASLSQLGLNGSFKRLSRTVKDVKNLSNETLNELKALPSPAKQPSSLSHLKGDEGCVVVLHIGESVRADRMGINGYQRETTPYLSSNPNAFSWRRCIASTGLTVTSLAIILTNARRGNFDITDKNTHMKATCGSVMDLFKANNFGVYSFQGALKRLSLRGEGVLRELTQACDDRYYTQDDIMESIPQIQACLNKNPNRNLFFLINNEGSHTPFYMYNQETPPFVPSMHILNPSSKYAEAVRNAYDNTIHYNDLFVHQVLQVLEGRPYVYLYVSDHGEYLGEYGGTWGRSRLGMDKKFFHKTIASAVGAFAICSPQFEKLHPAFAQATQNLKASVSMTIGHEHFFHTLLGLVGIQSPYYDTTLDLSSDQALPYTGEQPSDLPEFLKKVPTTNPPAANKSEIPVGAPANIKE